jgi:hypothetical protein
VIWRGAVGETLAVHLATLTDQVELVQTAWPQLTIDPYVWSLSTTPFPIPPAQAQRACQLLASPDSFIASHTCNTCVNIGCQLCAGHAQPASCTAFRATVATCGFQTCSQLTHLLGSLSLPPRLIITPPLQNIPQVANYALAMHSLSAEAAKERAGAAGREFRAAVATATARAMGARYKPEIAAAVKALPKKTPDGLAVDFALDTLKVRLGGGGSGMPLSTWRWWAYRNASLFVTSDRLQIQMLAHASSATGYLLVIDSTHLRRAVLCCAGCCGAC